MQSLDRRETATARSKVRLALAFALALGACHTRLARARGELAVGASELDFPLTYVGYPVTKAIDLMNRGGGALDVPIESTAPFLVEAGSVHLAGGTSYPLAVRFAPPAAGHYTGTLRAGGVEVALAGDAALPIPCPTTPCKVITFDPNTGTCDAADAPDGSPCNGGACLALAHCEAGQCVGVANACDDQNACTDDSCDPSRGCVHTPTAACPVPADPCQTATCDPATGCGTGAAADWTPCGAIDCVTAHLCFSGQCQAVSTPDGVTCASATPCQDRGTCQSGQCVQPPPHDLTPAWVYAPGWSFRDFGVADDAGNRYVQDSGALTSIGWDGNVRWKVQLDRKILDVRMVGGRVITVLDTVGQIGGGSNDYGTVRAFDPASGQMVWDYPLANYDPTRFALSDGDHVVLFGNDSHSPVQKRIFVLAAATGAYEGDVGAVGSISPAPGVTAGLSQSGIAAWSLPGGSPLWATAAPDLNGGYQPLVGGLGAIVGGFQAIHAFDASNGTAITTDLVPNPTEIVAGQKRVFVATLDPYKPGSGTVTGLDRTTWKVAWSVPAPVRASGLVLTGDEGVLFATTTAADTSGVPLLEYVAEDGSVRWSCRAPLLGAMPTFARQRLVTSYWDDPPAGFDVRGLTVADHGWISTQGSFGRANMPK